MNGGEKNTAKSVHTYLPRSHMSISETLPLPRLVAAQLPIMANIKLGHADTYSLVDFTADSNLFSAE